MNNEIIPTSEQSAAPVERIEERQEERKIDATPLRVKLERLRASQRARPEQYPNNEVVLNPEDSSAQEIMKTQAEELARRAAVEAMGRRQAEYEALENERDRIIKDISKEEKRIEQHNRLKNQKDPKIINRITKWILSAVVKSTEDDHDLHISNATARLQNLKARLAELEAELAKSF